MIRPLSLLIPVALLMASAAVFAQEKAEQKKQSGDGTIRGIATLFEMWFIDNDGGVPPAGPRPDPPAAGPDAAPAPHLQQQDGFGPPGPAGSQGPNTPFFDTQPGGPFVQPVQPPTPPSVPPPPPEPPADRNAVLLVDISNELEEFDRREFNGEELNAGEKMRRQALRPVFIYLQKIVSSEAEAAERRRRTRVREAQRRQDETPAPGEKKALDGAKEPTVISGRTQFRLQGPDGASTFVQTGPNTAATVQPSATDAGVDFALMSGSALFVAGGASVAGAGGVRVNLVAGGATVALPPGAVEVTTDGKSVLIQPLGSGFGGPVADALRSRASGVPPASRTFYQQPQETVTLSLQGRSPGSEIVVAERGQTVPAPFFIGNSTVGGNTSTTGGGISSGSSTIANSTVGGNTSTTGSGISSGSTAGGGTIANSTVGSNTATGNTLAVGEFRDQTLAASVLQSAGTQSSTQFITNFNPADNTLQIQEDPRSNARRGTATVVQGASLNPSVARLNGETGDFFGPAWPQGGPNSGSHIAFGARDATIPGGGTFTYNFVATTSPTYSNGSTAPGTLTGSAVVNFTSLTVGVAMTATMPDQTYTIQTPGGTANPAASNVTIRQFLGQPIHRGTGTYTTSPVRCAAGCSTTIGGNFYGVGATFSSILFATTLGGGVNLNGAALGQR